MAQIARVQEASVMQRSRVKRRWMDSVAMRRENNLKA